MQPPTLGTPRSRSESRRRRLLLRCQDGNFRLLEFQQHVRRDRPPMAWTVLEFGLRWPRAWTGTVRNNARVPRCEPSIEGRAGTEWQKKGLGWPGLMCSSVVLERLPTAALMVRRRRHDPGRPRRVRHRERRRSDRVKAPRDPARRRWSIVDSVRIWASGRRTNAQTWRRETDDRPGDLDSVGGDAMTGRCRWRFAKRRRRAEPGLPACKRDRSDAGSVHASARRCRQSPSYSVLFRWWVELWIHQPVRASREPLLHTAMSLRPRSTDYPGQHATPPR